MITVIKHKIGILVGDGFQILMLDYPFLRLREEGYKPLFIGMVRDHRVFDKNHQNEIVIDIDFEDARKRDWDLLVIPGGEINKDLVSHTGAQNLVHAAYQQGALIAAIGTGIHLLAKAEILEGHRCSAPQIPFMDTILAEVGGTRSDSSLTVDGQIITAKDVHDLPGFTMKMIDLLNKR